MKTFLSYAVLLCATLLASTATAQVFNLSDDYSDAVNPNGVWGYNQGATSLPHFPQPMDGNALNPAAANGFWGASPSFSFTPIVIKVTQDGSATAPYNNGDFLLGDVIAHATNPGAGGDLIITWTPPGPGSVSFEGSVWYAHSIVTRSNDFSIDLNSGAPLISGTVTNGQDRANAVTFSSGGSLNVAACDVLSFRLRPSVGQAAGSLSGIDWTLDFKAGVDPLLGDVNLDGTVSLLDVAPFVGRITTGTFQAEADINQDCSVNLLDVAPFVSLLTGG